MAIAHKQLDQAYRLAEFFYSKDDRLMCDYYTMRYAMLQRQIWIAENFPGIENLGRDIEKIGRSIKLTGMSEMPMGSLDELELFRVETIAELTNKVQEACDLAKMIFLLKKYPEVVQEYMAKKEAA